MEKTSSVDQDESGRELQRVLHELEDAVQSKEDLEKDLTRVQGELAEERRRVSLSLHRRGSPQPQPRISSPSWQGLVDTAETFSSPIDGRLEAR